jgi:hypothetical protein
LQMAAAKKKRFFAFVRGRSGGATDPVAQLIANDRAENDREQPTQEKELHRNAGYRGKNSGGDQQRVARQKKTDKHSGFDENDAADQRRATGPNKFFQPFGVKKQVQKVQERLEHATWVLLRAPIR